jgi:hypothetical protein
MRVKVFIIIRKRRFGAINEKMWGMSAMRKV